MWWDERQLICLCNEHRVDDAFEPSENVGTEIVNRTNEVLRSREEIRESEAEDDSADPSADEA